MNSRGETREQQPPDQPAPRPWQGNAFLALGASGLTAAILLCVLDQAIDHDFSRGFYSILTGLFVVGIAGWVSMFNEMQTRREAAREVRAVLALMEELSSRVEQLADEVAKPRVTYLPPQAKQYEGQRYMSTAVGGQGDTVPLQRVGLDAETIAAARSLARRIVDGPAEQSSES